MKPSRQSALAVLVAGVLSSCSAPEEGEVLVDSNSGGRDELLVEDPEPEWTAEDVEDAVLLAFAGGVPEPSVPREEYLGLMAQGDLSCPGDSHQILDTWLQGCTSDGGFTYAGISEWQEMAADEWMPKGIHFEMRMWALLGDFSIEDPDGNEFHSGGHVGSWRMRTGAVATFGGELAGSWLWEGHEGWLADEVSASLKWEGSELEGHVSLDVNGGITVGGVSLFLDHLWFPEDCRDQPEGGLGVRDPVGGWHEVQLTACEPCGELTFGGRAMGEVCPDLRGVGEAMVASLWGEGL